MKSRIAYLTWGNSNQIRSYEDYSFWLDERVYLQEGVSHDLSDFAAVIVPDAMDSEILTLYSELLNTYVRSGGTLVVFGGKTTAEWLDVVDLEWKPIFIRDWLWWTKEGAELELHQPEPVHPICDVIPLRDMGWHWMGVFALQDNAKSALNLIDDSGSLFLDFDELPGGGRLIVTTLDPHVHNGERFMPATTRFLDAFYPWLNRECGIVRNQHSFVFTYLQCYHHNTEWAPHGLSESIATVGGITQWLPMYDLSHAALAGTDVLYIPNNHDQYFLCDNQQVLLAFIGRGGGLIINGEPAISWLPFLSPFQAVCPRPFANLKVRIRSENMRFYANMSDGFDAWEGVYGQYARGWVPMPEGAIPLTEVGPQECPNTADWIWQYEHHGIKSGWVFMHCGDNLVRYPDHGPHKGALVRDIALTMSKLVLDNC